MTIEDIALQMTPGIGMKGAVHLLEVFGSASAIFAASVEDLVERAEIRPDLARQILRRQGFPAAAREIEYCRRNEIRIIASSDSEYPPLLREMPDYPIVLYVMEQDFRIVFYPSIFKGTSERCVTIMGSTKNICSSVKQILEALPSKGDSQSDTQYFEQIIIPWSSAGKLIGKVGSNVKRLNDEYHVEVALLWNLFYADPNFIRY